MDFINDDNQREVYRVVSENFHDLGNHNLDENGYQFAVANYISLSIGRFAFFLETEQGSVG